MSSAILYLAIVAIWAVVLVPRWLHPRAAQLEPAKEPAAPPEEPSGEPRSGLPDPTEPVPAEIADPGLADGSWAEPSEPELDGPSAAEDIESTPAPFPAQRRADVLQARRRMLVALMVLTAGAVGLAVTGMAASWVIAPPALLLAGFTVLLREASRIDAERAHRATGIGHAGQAPVGGQETEPAREEVQASMDQVPATGSAPATAGPPSGADVIDISGRIIDQVYDQYADAAERAVGD